LESLSLSFFKQVDVGRNVYCSIIIFDHWLHSENAEPSPFTYSIVHQSIETTLYISFHVRLTRVVDFNYHRVARAVGSEYDHPHFTGVFSEHLYPCLRVPISPCGIFSYFSPAHRTCPFSIEPHHDTILTEDMLAHIEFNRVFHLLLTDRT